MKGNYEIRGKEWKWKFIHPSTLIMRHQRRLLSLVDGGRWTESKGLRTDTPCNSLPKPYKTTNYLRYFYVCFLLFWLVVRLTYIICWSFSGWSFSYWLTRWITRYLQFAMHCLMWMERLAHFQAKIAQMTLTFTCIEQAHELEMNMVCCLFVSWTRCIALSLCDSIWDHIPRMHYISV